MFINSFINDPFREFFADPTLLPSADGVATAEAVMAGLVRAIPVDPRDKPGDDDGNGERGQRDLLRMRHQ
jgi:hypothetical protein